MTTIRSFYRKIDNFFSNGTMDSYHLEGLLYCISPLILALFFLCEVNILNFLISLRLGKISIVIELLLLVGFFIISLIELIFIFLRLTRNIKRKYVLFSFINLYLLLLSLNIVINNLFGILADTINIGILFFNVGVPAIFPFGNMSLIAMLIILASNNMMIIFIPMYISYSLNFFLPQSLQQKSVSIKDKLKRVFFKIVIFIMLFFVSYIFSIINKNNFSSLTIFTTLFSFVCTPKVILRIFSSHENIEKIKISEEIQKKFDVFKMIYYEFIFSWSIVIYFFEIDNSNEKMLLFIIIFSIIVLITVIVSYFTNKNTKKIFSNWIIHQKDTID